jgi:gallate dioxygenase
MARIIGAIASSHTPTIGFAHDRQKQNDPVWAPIFKAYEPIAQWIADREPDVLFYIFNDHVTSFFFDHYPMFALGIGDQWRPADEGGGPRALPPIQGDPELAAHIGKCLVAEEFDLSFFQDRSLDHGCFSPLSVMMPHAEGWPTRLIPLHVGVLQFPIPSAARCYKLGLALRRAIESYPGDKKVAIVATGGLSHQVHGERCGFNNTPWDLQFLELFEKDPAVLTEMTHADYARLGGLESSEIIMWLIMRGAMPQSIKCLHRDYYLPSMAGIATAIYEPSLTERPIDRNEDYRRWVDRQTEGLDKLEGTYPFTLATSSRTYRINRFLHSLVIPAHRNTFRASPEAAMQEMGLSDIEREMIVSRNWRAMIQYGVNFFLLEKLGAVVGVSNMHIYAHFRGQTLEEFQKTRNAPSALYSVAGTDSKRLAWESVPDK